MELEKIIDKRNIYEEKSTSYYEVFNPVVLSLLQPARRMLEVGCAEGLLAQMAVQWNLFTEMYGIELHPSSAEKAKQWYSAVFTSDIESFDLSQVPKADAIVCADVIEHLVDPWSTFSRFVQKLEDHGYFILSIPNARHVRVWGGLVFKGRFDYHESGVLDKGHLRFFALTNLEELFESNDLYIEKMVCNMAPKGRMINQLSLGLLREFFTFQYVFRLRKKYS